MRCWRYPLSCGQDTLKPGDQGLSIWTIALQDILRRFNQTNAGRVVGTPFCAVRKNSYVTLTGLITACSHIASKLVHGRCDNTRRPQVPFDLNYCVTDLDVNAATIPDLALKVYLKILISKVQATGQQQLPNVSLDRSLAAYTIAISQSPQQRGQCFCMSL